MKRRIYLATSWKNNLQPTILLGLRSAGHEVYDFRNPKVGDSGFSWSEIDPNWQKWNLLDYQKALEHPAAERGFKFDMDALNWADTCVLLLPCGRSAHLELGYAVGAGKKTVIIATGEKETPELMYKMVDLVTDSLVTAIAYLSH